MAGLAGLSMGAMAAGQIPARAASGDASRLQAPRGDLRLVAISDLNSSYGSTSYLPVVLRAVKLIPSWKPDLVLCGGDMVAGQKQGLSQVHLSAMWASFDRQLLAPLRRAGLPVAITMGNHDASAARSGGRYVFELDRQEAGRYWRGQRDSLGLEFVDASRFPFAYSVRQHDLFLLVWDASGTAWLVPGYIMRHGSEPWNASAVISVEEGVIALPEPTGIDIMPLPEGEQS